MVQLGEKTIIRDLEREDVDKMIQWGKHKEILFTHYNFPYLTERERDIWFKLKAKDKKKKCFAVDDLHNNLVGYISLRDIRYFRKESELGIVFDPGNIEKGLGTDALSSFLDLYFNELKMKKLILKVAKFNERAIKCYEKCGFRYIKEVLSEFEDQEIDLHIKEALLNNYEDIIKINNKLMTRYYYMAITKKEHNIHKSSQEMLISL